ncbi:hypothetical protein GCM10028798_02880 [Humibacter antri]
MEAISMSTRIMWLLPNTSFDASGVNGSTMVTLRVFHTALNAPGKRPGSAWVSGLSHMSFEAHVVSLCESDVYKLTRSNYVKAVLRSM